MQPYANAETDAGQMPPELNEEGRLEDDLGMESPRPLRQQSILLA